METKHLEEFVVLAEICNYNRAADALFISQSSLFNHIKSLESDLGVSLFSRKGKNIVLSDYGQIFLPYAKTIISTEKEYRQIVDTDKDKDKNLEKLCIATQYLITELVKGFRNKYHNYKIYVVDNYSAMEVLDDGVCELAFIRDVPEIETSVYNVIPYRTDTMAAAVYSSHPLAGRDKVRLGELKNEDFVMISEHMGQECYGMQLCKRAGFIPNVVMTASGGNEAARLVNEEMGISLFFKGIIASEFFDNVTMVDLDPPVECRISLCWRKDKELSKPAELFVEYVKGLQ